MTKTLTRQERLNRALNYSPEVEEAARAACRREYLDPDELIDFYHPRLGVFRAPLWMNFTTEASC